MSMVKSDMLMDEFRRDVAFIVAMLHLAIWFVCGFAVGTVLDLLLLSTH